MTKRNAKGRALFYTRDSGGKHETTPSEYVNWAIGESRKRGLQFTGTPTSIHAMIRNQQSVDGDIFLDYGVPGNILSRHGLNALIEEAKRDLEVSHILIPRRDRLSRPDDPTEGMILETDLRRSGLTLVFMEGTFGPLGPKERPKIADNILALLAYDRAGQDRKDLAQKVIHAQLSLAKSGFSSGGEPPYGFRRWLVKEDGTRIRQLAKGEIVRMRGHHVFWAPTQEDELAVIRRILDLLRSHSANKVATILTAENIPTPNHGRYRTDNGVRHQTSGIWHQNTVTYIARNRLLLAIVEYGRRSMGDQLRLTPEGPRELTEDDYCQHRNAPRVIRNPEDKLIIADAHFDPVVDPTEHRKLLEVLDERAGTQRGKPRSRDPNRNPLGCRVFDMACGWPMYRVPNKEFFRYKCGLYQQSSGEKCEHNHVDGLAASRFALSCIRQRLLSPSLLPKLEARIRQLASQDKRDDRLGQELARKQSELNEIDPEKVQIGKNMARAKNDAQYEAISQEFDRLTDREQVLKAEIKTLESQAAANVSDVSEVESTLEIVRNLTNLANQAENMELSRQLFDLIDVKLFLRFKKVKPKKRIMNRLTSGVITFGNAPAPVEIYKGATAREKIRAAKNNEALPPKQTIPPDGESKSLGNASRGDRI